MTAIFDVEEIILNGNGDRAAPAAANTPRTLVASAARIKLTSKTAKSLVRSGTVRDWQTAAWDYYDQIGEVKFAFGMIGSVMSRIRLYPGIIDDPAQPPVPISDYRAKHDEVPSQSLAALEDAAQDALDDLQKGFRAGGISQYLRQSSLNVLVAGEYYLVKVASDQWTVASVTEMHTDGSSWSLKQSRDSNREGLRLKKDNYTARIWRSHPRWSRDPDSSMLGILDQAEKLVLLDRVIRATARSRMSAGVWYIPDGVTINAEADEEEQPLEDVIYDALTRVADDEAAANTIVPLILRGPQDLAEAMSKAVIQIGRGYDAELQAAADRALERVLTGLDVPKDAVTGLADVKYANAIVIDDTLYKAHIEPLALHAVDSLSYVYLRPYLRKRGDVPPELIERAVFWYDPSEIVTKPDRSTAANEGFDRFTLSAEAWRQARGFSETDKPSAEEVVVRLAAEKAQMPADVMLSILQNLAPELFAQISQVGQKESGLPPRVTEMLAPGKKPAGQPTSPLDQTPPEQPAQGGNNPPGTDFNAT